MKRLSLFGCAGMFKLKVVKKKDTGYAIPSLPWKHILYEEEFQKEMKTASENNKWLHKQVLEPLHTWTIEGDYIILRITEQLGSEIGLKP